MSESKPKKKVTLIVSQLDDVLYFHKSGYVIEIPDPTGSISYLFELMDGSRTIIQLYELVYQAYPDVTYENLIDAIQQFDNSGLLEDGAIGVDEFLDDYEQGRWGRNLSFLESFASLGVSKYKLQQRIKSAKIALLGLGGAGSHLLYDLAAMGALDVRAVEFDRVELVNLNRQILYSEADIGRLKAEVATERIRAFSPRMRLEVIPMRISCTEDVMQIIHDREYVLCVADQPREEIIRWVNEACVRQRVPFIAGGQEMVRIAYYTVLPTVTGCVECWRQQVQRRDPTSAALIDERRRSRLFPDNGTFAPLISVLAGLMLCELTRLITGTEPPIATGKLMEFRFGGSSIREAEHWERLGDCPLCHVELSLPAYA